MGDGGVVVGCLRQGGGSRGVHTSVVEGGNRRFLDEMRGGGIGGRGGIRSLMVGIQRIGL